MTARPASRTVLEQKLRAVVPSAPMSLGTSDPRTNSAVAGATGLVLGFIWGWLRGRRRPK